MSELPDRIEIEDSYINKVRYIVNGFTILLIIINVIFPILWFFESSDIFLTIFLVVVSNVSVMPIIIGWIRIASPFYKVKLVISTDSIDFYIQNSLYLQFPWNELERIELIRVSGIGYKLNFKSQKQSNIVRLYLFIFKRTRETLTIDTLKQFANRLNKEFIELPRERNDNRIDFRKDLEDIREFTRENKYEKNNDLSY